MQASSDFRASLRTSRWDRSKTESIKGLLADSGPVVLLILTWSHLYMQNPAF